MDLGIYDTIVLVQTLQPWESQTVRGLNLASHEQHIAGVLHGVYQLVSLPSETDRYPEPDYHVVGILSDAARLMDILDAGTQLRYLELRLIGAEKPLKIKSRIERPQIGVTPQLPLASLDIGSGLGCSLVESRSPSRIDSCERHPSLSADAGLRCPIKGPPIPWCN